MSQFFRACRSKVLARLAACAFVFLSSAPASAQETAGPVAQSLCVDVVAGLLTDSPKLDTLRFECNRYLEAFEIGSIPSGRVSNNLAAVTLDVSRELAMKIADEGITYHPRHGALRILRIYFNSRFGNLDAAAGDYDALVKIGNDLDIYEAQESVGRWLLNDELYAEAVEFLTHVLKTADDNEDLRREGAIILFRAEALKRLGQLGEALIDYEDLVRVKFDPAFVHYNLCLVKSDLGDLADALEECDASLAADHMSRATKTIVLNLAARVARTSGAPEAAEHYIQECRDLYPETIDQNLLLANAQKFGWSSLERGPVPRCES